ncbi:MAG: M48 family peptidase, partial [Deltaproteobacteria bacterium]
MRLVILALLLVSFLLSRLAEFLNMHALRRDPPPELRGLYGAEEYRRSQRYARAKLAFGMLPATFDLLILLVFWGADGFDRLDAFVRSWGLGAIGTGLGYIGILALAQQILALPWEA